MTHASFEPSSQDATATGKALPSWPGHIELLDPPGRTLMFKIVLGVVALEPLFVLIVLLLVGIHLWIVAGIAAAVTIGIPLLGAAIVAMLWTPFAKHYPPQPIGASAVGKSYQSFGFALFSRFNNCIHIAVDENHLHLIPMKPLQLCGARPASLPWERVSVPSRSLIPGYMKAEIDGRQIFGPSWCLELAGKTSDLAQSLTNAAHLPTPPNTTSH